MPLITPERLNSYLSSPNWSDGQWLEVADVCAEVEGELEDALNAPISPRAARTASGALTDSGQLMLPAPVHSVSTLDGVVIPDGDPLPTGWRLEDGYLYLDPATAGFLGSGPGYGGVHHGFTVRTVPVTFVPGWGNRAALRSAILRKIRVRWLNQHDDTIIARNLEADAPAPLPEEWTEDELTRLNIYRWYTIWR